MLDRSLKLFEEGISSKESLKTYRFGLDRFINYYKLKSGDALLTIDLKKLQTMIEDYVMDLKKQVSPNSVSTYMKGVEHYFVMNDFILNWKKIHKLYPNTVKKGGGNAYTTNDIQDMLKLAKNLKTISLIHVLASTGCRIGAIPELKLRHVQDLEDGCKAIIFYPDSKSEYFGFLTPEASHAVDAYLAQRKRDGEYFSSESPLFRSKYPSGLGNLKAKHSTVGGLKNLIRKTVTKAVTRTKIRFDDGRICRNYDKAMDHAFRKRFNTILKNNKESNRSLVEKLMSREVKDIPLDGTYHDPDIKTLFDEFKKHIVNLTISDDERDKITIENLRNERDDLTKSEERNMRFAHEIRTLRREIGKIKNNQGHYFACLECKTVTLAKEGDPATYCPDCMTKRIETMKDKEKHG